MPGTTYRPRGQPQAGPAGAGVSAVVTVGLAARVRVRRLAGIASFLTPPESEIRARLIPMLKDRRVRADPAF